jgi:ABC-2 type transport system permease protein
MTAITAPQTRTVRSSGLLKLTATELKLLSRERVRAVLPVAIPLLLIVVLGNVHSFRQPQAIYGGESLIDLYTTIVIVMGLALLALTNMPMMLADYRERGVLRRLQTTPIGPVRVLAAQLAADLTVSAVMVIVIVAVARGIGALLFYPMMFFAGLWLPIPSMPAVLQHISHATPLGAAVPALTAAAEGSMPTALQLGTLAAWAVALGLTAARFFRWE